MQNDHASRPNLDPQPLDALMTLSQQGDAAAYERLLSEVALRMRRMLRSRAPWLSAADSEDVVQDILLSLHRARHTWDPARPFMPWIVTIARARLADNVRRYARRNAIGIAAADWSETFRNAQTNTNADTVINLLTVREALKSLTPAERQAITLLRLREMSLTDAARESGSSVAALKIAVHRAMRKLRKNIWMD